MVRSGVGIYNHTQIGLGLEWRNSARYGKTCRCMMVRQTADNQVRHVTKRQSIWPEWQRLAKCGMMSKFMADMRLDGEASHGGKHDMDRARKLAGKQIKSKAN